VRSHRHRELLSYSSCKTGFALCCFSVSSLSRRLTVSVSSILLLFLHFASFLHLAVSYSHSLVFCLAHLLASLHLASSLHLTLSLSFCVSPLPFTFSVLLHIDHRRYICRAPEPFRKLKKKYLN
jgi:hypothetical protein